MRRGRRVRIVTLAWNTLATHGDRETNAGGGSAMLRFFCTDCGHKLKAPPEQAGKRCKCTRCGQTMTIPGGSPEEAEEAKTAPPPAPPAADQPAAPARPRSGCP